MSNIDDIFKKGLEGKGMEYSDTSWAGMEQMLNSHKVGFFARYRFLLGFGSLLLISGIAFLYYEQSDATVNTPVVLTDTPLDKNATEAEVTRDIPHRLAKPSDKNPLVTVEPKKNVAIRQTAVSSSVYKTARPTGITINTISSNATYLDPTDNGFRNAEPHTLQMGSDVAASVNNSANVGQASMTSSVTSTSNLSSLEADTLVKVNVMHDITANGITVRGFAHELSFHSPAKMAFLSYPSKKKFSLYLSPYAGYVNYAKNVMIPEKITDEEGNLGQSNAQNSYNYGLNVGVKRGKWMLSSGIGVLRLKENTNYTETSETYRYTTVPKIANNRYATTPRGTHVVLITQQKVDSAVVRTTSRQVCEGCGVSFNYISVPLNLQYNFGKNRLRYFAEAGLNTLFLQKARGNYALPQQMLADSIAVSGTSIVALASSEEVSKIVLQANAAVGVKLWLTPRWNLWSSYGYGLGINSILSSYEQKSRTQYLRVGVEFKLR
ncbi:hypothetical protein N9772_04380 [Bacteroidia bacterium]|nr:hypothetical protein [Bacteroidia bacterium]